MSNASPDGHEARRDDVTRPMRAKINARITDRCRDNEIEPAPAPKKQRADHRDDHVVGHVPGRKRGPGFGAVGLVGKANGRFLEKRQELRMRLFQLNHPHSSAPASAGGDRSPSSRCNEKIVRRWQARQHGKKESAALESAEDQHIKPEPNEQRLPDFDIADRGHEQIERGIRPLFVNEMKDGLIHARKARHDTNQWLRETSGDEPPDFSLCFLSAHNTRR